MYANKTAKLFVRLRSGRACFLQHPAPLPPGGYLILSNRNRSELHGRAGRGGGLEVRLFDGDRLILPQVTQLNGSSAGRPAGHLTRNGQLRISCREGFRRTDVRRGDPTMKAYRREKRTTRVSIGAHQGYEPERILSILLLPSIRRAF